MAKDGELANIRGEIDEVDRRIVDLLAKRFKLVSRIPAIKERLGIPTQDVERESSILSRVGEYAEENGLSSRFARNIYQAILGSCTEFERSIRRKTP